MRSHTQSVVIEPNRRRISGSISYNPLISDIRVLIVCNKTGGTIKGDKKKYPVWNAHAPYCQCGLPALQYFSAFSLKGHDFRRKKKVLGTKCVFWFSLQGLFETFLILRRTERDMIKMFIGLHEKCPLFLSDFNETWIFSTDFRKNPQTSNFMKIRPVGAELLLEHGQTDGQTDEHDEANSRFSQFCERASKCFCEG